MYSISECLIPLKYMWQKQLTKVFCKKDVLGNFTKFTGKHLCQSLFFNKVAGLRSETLLKKRLWQRCFPVNFAKFLKTFISTEHLWTTASNVIYFWTLIRIITVQRRKFSINDFVSKCDQIHKKLLIGQIYWRNP